MEMHIGKRLRYIRVKNNLSQEKLARGIISISHLSNLESGRYSASEETIRFLAKKLKVKESYLLECFTPDENLDDQLSKLFITILTDVSNTPKILEPIREPINCIYQEWTYYYLTCSYYYKVNELDKAKDLEEKTLTYFISESDDIAEYPQILKQAYYYYKGISAYRNNLLELSYQSFNKLTVFLQSKKMYADIQYNLALISYQLADYFKAKKHSDLANEIYIQIGDLDKQADTHNFLGTIYCETYMFKDSLRELNKAMKFAKTLNISYLESRILHNKGLVYRGLGKNAKALEMFLDSYRLKVKMNSENIVVTIGELMECQISLGKYTETKQLVRTASQYMKTESDYHLLNSIKGNIDLHEGNESGFIKKKTDALNYFMQNNLKYAKGIAKELGDYYFENNKYKNAATYYKMELNHISGKGGEKL